MWRKGYKDVVLSWCVLDLFLKCQLWFLQICDIRNGEYFQSLPVLPSNKPIKNEESRKTKISSSKEIVWTACHIPVPEQMVVTCSMSVCALAPGRGKSAGIGAGCQLPCHPVWWWLGIEGVHFLPLSATVCRHGRGCRWLQSSTHHSVPPPCVFPSQRKKICLLPLITPLLPQATAAAGDAPLEKVGSYWVVGQTDLVAQIL